MSTGCRIARIALSRCPTMTDGTLRVLRLCYAYAYLRGREQAGLKLRPPELVRLANLRCLLAGEEGERRRGHRRVALRLHLNVRTPEGRCSDGLLLNISGGGMCISTEEGLPPGAMVQLRVRLADGAEYCFSGVVRWSAADGSAGVSFTGIGFTGIPVEVRHGYDALLAGRVRRG